jgi:allantoin racemase
MRILLINPNTSASFTDKVRLISERAAGPGTEVVAVNPDTGPRSIECIYDELLSSPGTLATAITHLDAFDAFVIACYSDHPTVYALREITTKPVLGIAEASMLTACMLGRKFSIVTTNREWEPLLSDAVAHYGLSERCASVRSTGMAVLALEEAPPEETDARIIEAARLAVEQDGAEVICLGCAGMAGLDKKVADAVHVPVVDGVVSALKLLEGVVSTGLYTSKRLAYSQPHYKQLDNLPEVFERPYLRTAGG